MRALEDTNLTVYRPESFRAARLAQGLAADLELLRADDFARAAASAGVARIVYRRPKAESASHHDEIARTLAAHGAAVTIDPVADELTGTAVPPGPNAVAVWSVQRLPLRPGRDARDVAEAYMRWLPQVLRPFVRVTVDETRRSRIELRGIPAPMLELTLALEASSATRQLYLITGGWLAGPSRGRSPRLEFRTVLDGAYVLAAVQEFVPRLPWLLYTRTQAPIHALVMRAFARHLMNT